MRIAVLLAMSASLAMAAPAVAQDTGVQRTGFTLQPARLPGMCMTMTGPAVEATSLPCTGGAAEKFDLPGAEGGPIRHDGKCLVPRGEGNYPLLAAVACDGSPEQTWKLNDGGEIRSAAGRCVSLLGASSRNGELIYAAECPKDYEAQGWVARKVDFTNVADASLESAARSGQCIGYDPRLALYPCNDMFRQVMSFDRKALGQIRLMSSCLSGGFAFGALRLGECWDQPEQKWMFFEDGRVVNEKMECIEVVIEEGRDVLRTKACSDVPEQRWRVRLTPAQVIAPAVEAAVETAAPVADEQIVVTSEKVDSAPVADAPPVAPPVAEAPIAPVAPPVIETPVPAAAPVAAPAPLPTVATLVTTLQHEQLPGMCMTLSGRDGESESRPCDGSAIQSFQMPGTAPGAIRNGDRCLAPRGQGTYPQLAAMACDGTSAQSWVVLPTGEVRNAEGRCLSLLGTSSRLGERIYAGECPTNLPAHRWRVVSVDPAALHPVSATFEAVSRPGKCLGTDGVLGVVDCSAKLGRVFSLDRNAPSQLRMMSSCLAGGFVSETLVMGQCWDMPAQKWMLNGASNLVNLQGKCLSVVIEGGRDVLRTANCLPVPEQQWILKEVAQ